MVSIFDTWEMWVFLVIEYYPVVNAVLPLILHITRCLIVMGVCRYNRKCRTCQNMVEIATLILFALVSQYIVFIFTVRVLCVLFVGF